MQLRRQIITATALGGIFLSGIQSIAQEPTPAPAKEEKSSPAETSPPAEKKSEPSEDKPSPEATEPKAKKKAEISPAEEEPGDQAPDVDREAQKAMVQKKMKFFQDYAGEWIGEEGYEVINTGQKLKTKDSWKGVYSLGGAVFEMHGQSDGDMGKSTYKWMITYDVVEEAFHAWIYDQDGSTEEYWLEWDDEEKTLLWMSEREDDDRLIQFTLKLDGNEIKGEGDISRLSDGQALMTTQMKYRRKVVSI